MYFFNKDNDKCISTYIKKEEINECWTYTNNIILTQDIDIINNEFSDQIYYNYFIHHKSGCTATDENFIGTFIFHRFFKYRSTQVTKEDFIDNFKLSTEQNCIDRLQNIPIEIKSELKKISEEIIKDIYYIKPIVILPYSSYKNSKELYDNVYIIKNLIMMKYMHILIYIQLCQHL